MKGKKDIGKAVLAVFFLAMIYIIGIKSDPYMTFADTITMIGKNLKGDLDTDDVTVNEVKENYADDMWLKSQLINLNGVVASSLNMKGYYSSQGIYVTDERYIVSSYPETTTDYEYEQLVDFKEYLDEKEINLLYVSAPAKYLDDEFVKDEFGIQSYSNQNTDLFLQRISGAGIDYIDLRENIQKEEMNIYDMFYRTDHHWTTRSGLWATRIIAEAMNEKCGYNIDMSIYDSDNYKYTEYEDSWLGEQGRKLAVSYVGLDDYELIEPMFDTSFIVENASGVQEGTFDIMLDKSRLSADADVYNIPSWHYTYMPSGIHESAIHNNNVTDGKKILVLADSYSHVVVPFLSLGVSDVETLVLRSYDESLREYIEENEFDTVLVIYAQFMIGAHDDPASANYDMFDFR